MSVAREKEIKNARSFYDFEISHKIWVLFMCSYYRHENGDILTYRWAFLIVVSSVNYEQEPSKLTSQGSLQTLGLSMLRHHHCLKPPSIVSPRKGEFFTFSRLYCTNLYQLFVNPVRHNAITHNSVAYPALDSWDITYGLGFEYSSYFFQLLQSDCY